MQMYGPIPDLESPRLGPEGEDPGSGPEEELWAVQSPGLDHPHGGRAESRDLEPSNPTVGKPSPTCSIFHLG